MIVVYLNRGLVSKEMPGKPINRQHAKRRSETTIMINLSKS